MYKKILPIVLMALSFSVSFSSHADSNADYKKIQQHWGMIVKEKDVDNRNQMIKQHRMMLNNFDKGKKMNSQHKDMQSNHMNGMSGEHINMMNSMDMQRLEMNMMQL